MDKAQKPSNSEHIEGFFIVVRRIRGNLEDRKSTDIGSVSLNRTEHKAVQLRVGFIGSR
jgi:hypothetical protein